MQPHNCQWSGKFLQVIKAGHWEYADRVGVNGAVAIVAVTPEGKLVLTEQYRIPVKSRVLELPAGLAGDSPEHAGEATEQAARRELLEETGFAAGTLVRLASGPPSAGLASELVTFFLARDLQRRAVGGGDGTEEIHVHEVALREIDSWLAAHAARGILIDPKVYAGLYLLAHFEQPQG